MTDGATSVPLVYTTPTPEDIVEWLPQRPADHRIRYGTDAQQFGDLRLPATPPPAGGYPVIVILHGGGYSPNWPYDHISLLAESLTAAGGVATWNLEYRKPGQNDGGWPGTWLDIGSGIDHVRLLAQEHPLNLDRVVALGHSAGGTFVSWAAGRSALPADSELSVPDPLELCGLVALAPMFDLDEFMTSTPKNLSVLLGAHDSSPEAVQARIALVSPTRRGDLITIPQAVIIGSLDDASMIKASRIYVAAAQARGTEVSLDCLEGANHFDVVDPTSAAWPVVAARTLDLGGVTNSPARERQIAARLTAY